MENETKVLSIAGELNRIRLELGFSRNDFALMFHVTPYAVDAWIARKSKPNATNTLQIIKFLTEIREIHKAIGLFVLTDKAIKNSMPVRTQAINNRYCENNRLQLTAYKSASPDELYNAESVYKYFTADFIRANAITDFVFYSKETTLSSIKKKELKEAGILVVHNLINNSVTIEKL